MAMIFHIFFILITIISHQDNLDNFQTTLKH